MKPILFSVVCIGLMTQFVFAQCDVTNQPEKNRVYHAAEKLYENPALENGVLVISAYMSRNNGQWYLTTLIGTNMHGLSDFKARYLFMSFEGEALNLEAENGGFEQLDGVQLQTSVFPLTQEQVAIFRDRDVKYLFIGDRELNSPVSKIEIYAALFREQVKCIEKY